LSGLKVTDEMETRVATGKLVSRWDDLEAGKVRCQHVLVESTDLESVFLRW
jgi:hypothetical protein